MVTLQTRIISGKGVLKLDTNNADYKKSRVLTLYASVIRPSVSEYSNFNYNPPLGKHAFLTFLRGDYVMERRYMEFSQQRWDFYPEIAYQSIYAIQCAYAGILQSYINLGTALGLPVVSVTDNISEWRHTDLFWDTVKVVCYGSTAIQLDVVVQEYSLCPEQEDPEPKGPPLPPPPPPFYEPDTPLGSTTTPASPAYDEGTGDEGDTSPFPGDEIPPEGGDTGDTEVGVVYSVTLRYRQFPGGDLLTIGNIPVLGVVGEVRFTPSGAKVIQLWCQGRAPNPFSPPPPAPPGWVDIEGVDSRAVDLSIESIAPYF